MASKVTFCHNCEAISSDDPMINVKIIAISKSH